MSIPFQSANTRHPIPPPPANLPRHDPRALILPSQARAFPGAMQTPQHSQRTTIAPPSRLQPSVPQRNNHAQNVVQPMMAYVARLITTRITPATQQIRHYSSARATSSTHGNSLSSTTEQHVYEIVDTATGSRHKVGISGAPLTTDSSGKEISRRAQNQVTKLNAATWAGRYLWELVAKSIPGRAAAAQYEQHLVNVHKNGGGAHPSGQARPLPNDQYGPGAR
jgi:hypothetical protein